MPLVSLYFHISQFFPFSGLAKVYSGAHTIMADPDRKPCDKMGNDHFDNGITNGAQWYSVKGGKIRSETMKKCYVLNDGHS